MRPTTVVICCFHTNVIILPMLFAFIRITFDIFRPILVLITALPFPPLTESHWHSAISSTLNTHEYFKPVTCWQLDASNSVNVSRDYSRKSWRLANILHWQSVVNWWRENPAVECPPSNVHFLCLSGRRPENQRWAGQTTPQSATDCVTWSRAKVHSETTTSCCVLLFLSSASSGGNVERQYNAWNPRSSVPTLRWGCA